MSFDAEIAKELLAEVPAPDPNFKQHCSHGVSVAEDCSRCIAEFAIRATAGDCYSPETNIHYNCGFTIWRSTCPTGEHTMPPVWATESTLRRVEDAVYASLTPRQCRDALNAFSVRPNSVGRNG